METYKQYLQPKDYNELVYFTNKMKYNLIDNDKNHDLEKTLVVYGKHKTGKTTLKVLIENYLGVETKPNLELPENNLDNIMFFVDDESITHNNYTIYFTNDKNKYNETNVYVELLHQF